MELSIGNNGASRRGGASSRVFGQMESNLGRELWVLHLFCLSHFLTIRQDISLHWVGPPWCAIWSQVQSNRLWGKVAKTRSHNKPSLSLS